MELQPRNILKRPLNLPQKILMGSGPSNASERVLKALSQPILGHLHPECLQIMDEIKAGIRYIFQTGNEATMCLSGAGHAGMEMALCNFIEDDTIVLIGSTGHWGIRAADIARRHGAKIFEVEANLGEALTVNQIKNAFDAYKPEIFFIAQGESSTGVLQTHLQEIGELCRLRNCIFIVDSVASLGGTEFRMDSWCIDVAYTGSQKFLGAPPGITPISFNERAMKRIQMRKTKVRVYYMDATLIGQYWGCYGWSRIYHHTISSPLLMGLREALSQICEEGLEACIRRHQECAIRLQKGLEGMGLQLFVDNPANRLPTVNTIKIPEGVDWKRIQEYAMKNYSLELSGGLGPTVNKVFRIGIMGVNATPPKVDFMLKVFREALANVQHAASKM